VPRWGRPKTTDPDLAAVVTAWQEGGFPESGKLTIQLDLYDGVDKGR